MDDRDASKSIAHLSPEEKRALLAQLLRKKVQANQANQASQEHSATQETLNTQTEQQPQAASVVHPDLQNWSPLSQGQRALWFLFQLAPQSTAYNLLYSAHVRIQLDIPALQRSVQALVRRYPILTATYTTRDGEPVHLFHADATVPVEVIDASKWDEEYLRAQLYKEGNQPFDLERGPVLRLKLFQRGGNDNILALTIHHIAADLWSLDLLIDELLALYAREQTGLHVALPSPGIPFTEYVRWQNEMLTSAEGERHCHYWQQELSGEPAVLHLPTDRPRPSVQTYRGDSHGFSIDDSLVQRLKTLASSQKVTLYTLLLAAYTVLMFRYTEQEDMLIGTPTLGRSRADMERVIGYLANPVVVRTNLANNPTFTDLLEQVRQKMLHALDHQDYPFPLLVEKLQPKRDPGYSPLIQTLFIWDRPQVRGSQNTSGQNGNALHATQQTLALEPFLTGQQGAPLDLTLTIFEVEGSLSGDFHYNTDLFDGATIARMGQHFQVLLHSIVEQPAQHITALPMLTAEEHQRILVEWNDTQRDYPDNACLHQLFEQQVERTPDAIALTFENTSLTYRELNSRANQVAHQLQAMGIGPDMLVGVCMERSLEMVIALLATLKAGGAYVPLEPSYPQERLTYIIDDAHISTILTQTRFRELLPQDAHVLYLDDEQTLATLQNDENPVSKVIPDNLVYVIYTSGSTGKPKGVMNIHRALANRLHWMQRTYHLTDEDRVMQKTPFSFDVSVWEFFWPLLYGSHLVVARPKGHQDTGYLASLIQEQSITTMHFVPSMLRAFLAEPGIERCTSLKRVICSGEALTYDLQEQFFAHFDAELHNLYGPTEAAIDVTAWQCQRESHDTVVPIGRPIDNTQIYILNRSMQPVPIGVAGELHIGGVGLARGYLNRPELTANKFIPNPFVENRFIDSPNIHHLDSPSRLFKSGDLARYRPDGAIEFLGRIDHQVKIHGVRIELGEVEATLAQHPDIQQVVVVAREDTPNNKRLVAYLATRDSQHLSVEELRGFLKETLPQDMIPSAFVFLDALPLLSNGKVNRAALPAPDTTRPELEATFVAPRNETEEQLATIWSQVLGIDQIGIHDNFFDLGGASIQTLQVVTKANESNIPLSPEMLFEYQTIAELMDALTKKQAKSNVGTDLSRPTTDNIYDKTGVINDTDMINQSLQPDTNVGTDLSRPATGNIRDERDVINQSLHTIIESIGVYLPPKVVSTKEILEQCSTPIRFPLAQLTGIKTRRMAGETEFAVDLAKKAVADCLANSKYTPDDIDLVICTSISRYNGPDFHITFEPSTAIQIQQHFGFQNALSFDVSNACTGMFTGMYIVDAFLKAGLIRRGLVVSGEYITHLTKTAQQEIESYMDSRLACLTVGDAGAAVILDRSPDTRYGFHEFDMYTVGRYYDLCIAKPSDKQNSGAIMYTDAVRVSAVNIQQAVSHASHIIKRSGWSQEAFQHIVMHQTSKMTIYDAGREINTYFGKELCNEQNLINNIAERGNTATTTHTVALMDHIRNGDIQSNSNVIFGITGSGVNIGTAIYTFDDLPDRLRHSASGEWRPEKVTPTQRITPLLPRTRRVQVESIGTFPSEAPEKRETLEMVRVAAEHCFANSSHSKKDIDLLIYAGVYRDEYISEPAIAAMVAGTLDINADVESQNDKKTFSFDLFNGSTGFLDACYTSIAMMQGQQVKTAMVVASEVENNHEVLPTSLRGIEETASVVLLDESKDGQAGFGNFVFKHFTEYLESLNTYTIHTNGRIGLHIEQDPQLERYYRQCIEETVHELLRVEQLAMSDMKIIVPPQISSSFIDGLSETLSVERERFVNVHAKHDLFTSSTAFGLQQVREKGLAKSGDIGLLIEVGAGIQVACATYHF